MVYMTWLVMFGNGVRIGMERIITVVHQLRIHQGRTQALCGCCGVVFGAALLATCGWLPAATTIPIIEPTTSGSDVWRICLNYPFATGQSDTNTARRRFRTERERSRLIAVVRLGNGFPLMLGAGGSDFQLYKRQNPYHIPLISGCAKNTGGWRNQPY